MLLSSLLKDVEVISEFEDCEINDVYANTNENLLDSAFVCIKGEKNNGNDFANIALQNGARAIITEQGLGIPCQVVVKDARKAYALMCSAFYGKPANGLTTVATTGTNGKTSVTTIVSAILAKADIRCGNITTIRASFEDYSSELSNTTPDPHTLYKVIADMRELGCGALTLEASSHALVQHRLYGLCFDVAVFTNLTTDHLDYHKDMEDYYQAKKKLFSMAKYAVINIDDEYGRRLTGEIDIPFSTYSVTDHTATFFADNISYNNEGVIFTLHHDSIETKVSFAIPGQYSVMNVLASAAACRHLGVSFETITIAVHEICGIIGRSEVIKTGRDFSVICDFAHTPDGLYNIIKSTRQYAKGRIIVVFGCGGDRDKTKRPLMGAVAAENADFAVITSDNPRTEKPIVIINDILKGIKQGSKYIAIENRSDAIRYAVAIAEKNDIIILAGKGHERYNQLGDKKIYYDERKIVESALKSLG